MAQKKYKTTEQKKKEIDQLTEMRNNEIERFFTTQDQLRDYLTFMSKFYNYSFRNSILIQKQFHGAEAVGSFKFWKDKGFSVQKGEKGIKILAPYTYKTFEREKNGKRIKTPVKYATKEEKAAIDRNEISVKENLAYTTGHVFDISQTNAKQEDLPYIFPNKWLDGEINNYDEMYASLDKLANKMNVTIHDEPMQELGVSKGMYVEYSQRNTDGVMEHKKGIELNPRNSEINNIKTLIHELAHARLHNTDNKNSVELNHNEKEFQAEMTAYTVCSHFNIDTSDYSLDYLHNYTKDHDKINDKMQLLEEVKDTSYQFITHLENDLTEVREMNEEMTNNYSDSDNRDKTLQSEYKDVQIITNNDVVTIGSLSLDDFKSHFHDQHNRNILDNKEFQNMNKQEVIQAFNNSDEQWNKQKDTIKMVDNTLNEPHAYVVWSETNIRRDLKPITDMDKALAEKNVDSIAAMGYDKTKINYIVPTQESVEIKSIDRIDLGDSDYTNLHDHIKQGQKELANLTPKTDLNSIYSTENLTNKLETAYRENLEVKGKYNKDDMEIERSDAGLHAIENFSKKVGALNDDDISSIKNEVKQNYDDKKEYQDIANNVVTLKGQYESYQKQLKAENTGELTEEKVINRMDAENQYNNMKQKVKENSNTPDDVIERMESDTIKQQHGKTTAQEKNNPFEKTKSMKQKERGMSM